jgi:hypothetical protein
MQLKGKLNRSGRPPKFRESRHPVTMTLPERILDHLTEIDPDRTRAVVKVTETVLGISQRHFKPVELVEMAPGKFLIVVGPSKALREIYWIKLIEIAPVRYLVTIPSGTPFEALEAALREQLSNPKFLKDKREKAVLNDLLNLIDHHRRSQHLSKSEILIIDIG